MANKNESLRITVPDQATRLEWVDLESLPFSTEEQFEIIQRWCDHADRQKSYHKLRNLKMQADALKAKALEAQLTKLAKAAGMSLEEYLETESTNLLTGEGDDNASS